MSRLDSRIVAGKEKYEGKVFSSKSYGDFRVIEYHSAIRILIEFTKTSYRRYCTARDITLSSVKDLYFPSICGVGYLGEGVYRSIYYRNGKKYNTPAYEVWLGKLRNCYGNTKMSHVYQDVTFCQEWLNFQVFAKWFYAQVKIYGKGGYVDKDLLFLGNKTYAPETCAYIPPAINSLFTGTSGNISGVHFDNTKKKWVAQIQNGLLCSNGKKRQTYLGMYVDKAPADAAYYEAKLKHVKEVTLKYQEQIPPVLFYKLYHGTENYLNYYMFDKDN